MGVLRILAGPLIGALIGYITNYFAIKMLFRPLNPVTLGRFRIPFTPGIVPRRKNELAGTLGRAVVAKFFNYDDLETIFTSDYFADAVADNITGSLYDRTQINTLTYADRGEDWRGIIEGVKGELCLRIQEGIIRSGISRVIAEEGGRIAQRHFTGGLVGAVISPEIISAVAEPLGETIEKSFAESGREILMPLLDAEFLSLSGESAHDALCRIVPDRRVLRRVIREAYLNFMRTHVRPIVESIDIGGMITEKIVQMEARDIEGLVLDVVKRELNYVVALGALLGFVIGIVNIFI